MTHWEPPAPPPDTGRPASTLPPPPPSLTRPVPRRKAQRPQWILVVVVGVAIRFGRELLSAGYGWVGYLIGLAAVVAAIAAWRAVTRRKKARTGGTEYTPEMLAAQFERSGAGPPAFAEDGTLLGASLYAINQRSKVIEVVTQYEIFGSLGQRLGYVTQIGQGRAKRFFRFFGNLDQLFTHHFDVTDVDDNVVLRLTRPRKIFRSRVEVFDERSVFVGRVVQRNVFGKIDFRLFDSAGLHLATMHAENWRAWDFSVETPYGLEIARITKSFEGWARTLLSNADSYVVHVHHELSDPLRQLVAATALTIDLALKQDVRGLGVL